MYKKLFDYDEQLKTEGKIEGKIEGHEEMIRRAIENNYPMEVLEDMSHGANISHERLKQLIKEVKSTLMV